MLVRTRISIMVISTLSWTYLLKLIVWTRGKLPLQNQGILWEYQVRGWLPLWLSVPKVQTRKKLKFSITDITKQYFRKLIKGFKISPILGYKKKHVHNQPTEVFLFLIIQDSKQIKTKRDIWLLTKGVKLDVGKSKHANKTIGDANKTLLLWIEKNGK